MKALGSHFDFIQQKKYLLSGISTTLALTIMTVVYTVGFQNIASMVTMNYVLSYIAYLIMTANRLTMTFLFVFFLLSVRRRFLQINNYLRFVVYPVFEKEIFIYAIRRALTSIRYSARQHMYLSALENENYDSVLVQLSVSHEKMGEILEMINKCFSIQVRILIYNI